jgi:multidrug efflux pump subunit AcrB
MLPFDNKNEFQVIIDMPEGTTLDSETTKKCSIPINKTRVVNYQNYIGTSAPITFNGLVRHCDNMRSGSNMADIQVNLLHKEKRRTNKAHLLLKICAPMFRRLLKK